MMLNAFMEILDINREILSLIFDDIKWNYYSI